MSTNAKHFLMIEPPSIAVTSSLFSFLGMNFYVKTTTHPQYTYVRKYAKFDGEESELKGWETDCCLRSHRLRELQKVAPQLVVRTKIQKPPSWRLDRVQQPMDQQQFLSFRFHTFAFTSGHYPVALCCACVFALDSRITSVLLKGGSSISWSVGKHPHLRDPHTNFLHVQEPARSPSWRAFSTSIFFYPARCVRGAGQ